MKVCIWAPEGKGGVGLVALQGMYLGSRGNRSLVDRNLWIQTNYFTVLIQGLPQSVLLNNSPSKSLCPCNSFFIIINFCLEY